MSDNNRVSHKPNDYRRDADRPRPQPLRIPDKSPFQRLLDESTQFHSDTSPGSHSDSFNPAATKEAVKPAVSHQERSGHQKDQSDKNRTESESEREDSRSGGVKSSERPHAKEAEKRVISKNDTSHGQHQGQGKGSSQQGGSHSGFGQGRSGKNFSFHKEAAQSKELQKADLQEARAASMPFEEMLRSNAMPDKKGSKEASRLSKAVLDQIVQYCRLIQKTDGDKEMEMQLHEEVFKGLRLRVTVVKGKVAATILTQSDEMRSLFQSQKGNLTQALSEKGIEVKSIDVIMV